MTTGQANKTWRVTPEEIDGQSVYTLYTQAGDTWAARCFPDQHYVVRVNFGHTYPYELEFWFIRWPRLLSTLLETARVGEQSKDRSKLVDDGDFSDTSCSECGKAPDRYERWGERHVTCGGTWLPR